MRLKPPYTVRESAGRALIVPENSAARSQAIAEAMPYGRIDSAEDIARAIAATLNWHPQLVGALGYLCRELAGSPRNLTRRQQVALIQAAQLLKDVR